jgi:hypothetical protein
MSCHPLCAQMELAYSTLSRVMLLLSSAATAAADYDEKYEVQDRVSLVIRDAYTRASTAVAEAQNIALETSARLRTNASVLYERATQLDLTASAREALRSAEERVTAYLDAAPEGSILASARDSLVVARADLADVRRAWDEGAEDGGMMEAASSAIAVARSKLEAASVIAIASAERARDDALETARLAAMATLASARERVELARGHVEFVKARLSAPLVPAVTEATQLGKDGVARLQGAALVLAKAVEDVAVEAAAMGDRAMGCSARTLRAWDSLKLESTVSSAKATAAGLLESEAVKGCVGRMTELDGALCCGTGSRVANGTQRLATALWEYGQYFVGRVRETKAVLASMDDGYDLRISKAGHTTYADAVKASKSD